MERGTIPVATFAGGLDLYRTLESGQTYRWRREDGRMYREGPSPGQWYRTVHDGEVIQVRQRDGHLEWRGTDDVEAIVRRSLGLNDDLEAIRSTAPTDPLVQRAFGHHRGLRLVEDPPFETLIAFICSAQMRVGRIHGMVSTLAETYGEPIPFDGDTQYAFPTPDRLAAATEADLRELGLGYRAPYVRETARMVADGKAHPETARELDYEVAREYLTQFVGVGEKVADCVLLFALEFDDPVPLDTWIRSAIADHFPNCDRGDYVATSRAIRARFGPRAGYVQTYVFHELRTGGESA